MISENELHIADPAELQDLFEDSLRIGATVADIAKEHDRITGGRLNDPEQVF
jgi:hypothetical protein